MIGSTSWLWVGIERTGDHRLLSVGERDRVRRLVVEGERLVDRHRDVAEAGMEPDRRHHFAVRKRSRRFRSKLALAELIGRSLDRRAFGRLHVFLPDWGFSVLPRGGAFRRALCGRWLEPARQAVGTRPYAGQRTPLM